VFSMTPLISTIREVITEEAEEMALDVRARAGFSVDKLILLAITLASLSSALGYQAVRWRFGR